MTYRQFEVMQNAVTGFNEHQYAHAATYLEDGAIGVGEDHTHRAGRDFATRLIEAGLVRNLFLEGKSSAQSSLDRAAKAARDSRSSARLKRVVNDAGPRYFSLPMTLGDVAAIARRKNVNIHLIDKDVAEEVGYKSKYERVAARDFHAAERFARITAETGTVGSMVLYGAVHLMRGKPWYPDENVMCLGELLSLTSFIAVPEVLPVLPRKRTPAIAGA